MNNLHIYDEIDRAIRNWFFDEINNVRQKIDEILKTETKKESYWIDSWVLLKNYLNFVEKRGRENKEFVKSEIERMLNKNK
jgi:predicted nucleic-acid-binding protein